MNTLSIIVAIDRRGAIGKEGGLLWHLPNDLKFFKTITAGHTVVMGRRTFESLPNGALPNRRNIVLTRSDAGFEGCTVCHSFDEAMALTAADGEVFIIGGADLYRQALPLADRLYLTEVEHTFDDADTFFPAFDRTAWHCLSTTVYPADERNRYSHRISTFVREK